MRKRFLILWLFDLLLFCDIGKATEKLEINYDKSTINLRMPADKAIENFKSNKDFQYEGNPKVADNFFNQIFQRLGEFLRKLFAGINLPYFLIYIIFILLLAFFVFLFIKSHANRIISRDKSTGKLDFTEITENLDSYRLDDLIRTEINNKNYRLATRYLFLKFLKTLDKKNFISWENEKTNRDYYLELSKTQYQKKFKDLSVIYEHV